MDVPRLWRERWLVVKDEKHYVADVDLWYTPDGATKEKHVVAGDPVDDLPATSIAPELEVGHIHEVSKP